MYKVSEKDSKIDILVFYETFVQMLLKSKIFPGQVLSKRNDKKLMKHVINILASVIYCHSSYLDQKFLHFKLIFPPSKFSISFVIKCNSLFCAIIADFTSNSQNLKYATG